jgi:L-malate glycosyltransferase
LPVNTFKLAYLLGSLNRGGTETLLSDVFDHAGEAEFKFIGIHRKNGSFLGKFTESGVPMFNISIRNSLDIGYFVRLRNLLIQQSISVVHAQQPFDALLVWIAVRGTGIKVILTLHGYDIERSIIQNLINRFILKRTSINIFVSHAQKKYYLEKYYLTDNAQQQVVHNGISFHKFDHATGNSIRKEFGIPASTFLLCSIGNFVPARDQLTLCRFLALLKQEHVDFRMIFAGARIAQAPQVYDACVSFCQQNGLKDHVLFAGSRTDVPDILAQSDAFIYACHYETFGIAVIEAMSSGLPVFVNDWDVLKEVVGGEEHAIIYKSGNENDLLDKFLSYLANPKPYVDNATQAALWVKEEYDIKIHMQALTQVYNQLF